MPKEQKDHIIIIVIKLFLTVLTLVVVKKYIIPILPELSLTNILDISIRDILKIFETVAVMILLATFVLEELTGFFAFVFQKQKHSVENNTRWYDLAYLFTVVFGSFGFYAFILNIAGW